MAFDSALFNNLLSMSEREHLHRVQLIANEDSLKYYRDLKNSLDTAREEGFEEGKIEGKIEGISERNIEIARQMLAEGDSIEKVKRITGLSMEAIVQLKRN